jgi:hypothetical protein
MRFFAHSQRARAIRERGLERSQRDNACRPWRGARETRKNLSPIRGPAKGNVIRRRPSDGEPERPGPEEAGPAVDSERHRIARRGQGRESLHFQPGGLALLQLHGKGSQKMEGHRSRQWVGGFVLEGEAEHPLIPGGEPPGVLQMDGHLRSAGENGVCRNGEPPDEQGCNGQKSQNPCSRVPEKLPPPEGLRRFLLQPDRERARGLHQDFSRFAGRGHPFTSGGGLPARR